MGSRDPKAISEFYLNLGAKTVITKVGSRGAYAATAQRQFMVKGFRFRRWWTPWARGTDLRPGFSAAF